MKARVEKAVKSGKDEQKTIKKLKEKVEKAVKSTRDKQKTIKKLKERVEQAIKSTKDEQEIIKKLDKLLARDPSLINEKYAFSHSMFHLLVKQGKVKAIESLCANEEWHQKASEGDVDGNTVLHVAIYKNTSTLERMIKLFPELLNKPNRFGNTPLHAAVLRGNGDIIQTLLANSAIDRFCKNQNGNTPFMLTSNHQLRELFLTPTDQLLIESLYFRSPASPAIGEINAELRKQFPSLCVQSSPRAKVSPSSSPREPEELVPLVSSSSPKEAFPEREQEALNRSGQIIGLMHRSQQEKDQGNEHKNLQNEFNALCNNIPFAERFTTLTPEGKPTLDDQYKTTAAKELFIQALKFLQPFIHQNYLNYQKAVGIHQKRFLALLLNTLPQYKLESLSKPSFPASKEIDVNLRDELWAITVCQLDDASPREIDLIDFNHCTIGLLSAFPFENIINHLIFLYPHFDTPQKLLAHFMTFQLLIYNTVNEFHFTPAYMTQVRAFCKKEEAPTKSLESLSAELSQVAELSSALLNNPAVKNFHALNQLVRRFLPGTNQSFESLIDTAIQLPEKERSKYVECVAEELKTETRLFYQNVSIREFNCNWVTCKADAPSIAAFTTFNDKLAFYLVEKMLTQANHALNLLQFLIELSQAICPIGEERSPDLSSLECLGTVLEHQYTNKLIKSFKKNLLHQKQVKILNELSTLFTPTNNSYYKRKIYATHFTAFPSLGLTLRDIEIVQKSRSAMGKALRPILELKMRLQSELPVFKTNLPIFVAEYTKNEEKIRILSFKIQPSTFNFNRATGDLEEIIATVNSLYLDENILPASIFNPDESSPDKEKFYSVNQFLDAFLNFVEHSLKKKLGDYDEAKLTAFLEKIRVYAIKIMEINNKYAQPNDGSHALNPLFQGPRIVKWAQQILDAKLKQEKLLSDSENSESNSSEINDINVNKGNGTVNGHEKGKRRSLHSNEMYRMFSLNSFKLSGSTLKAPVTSRESKHTIFSDSSKLDGSTEKTSVTTRESIIADANSQQEWNLSI